MKILRQYQPKWRDPGATDLTPRDVVWLEAENKEELQDLRFLVSHLDQGGFTGVDSDMAIFAFYRDK